MDSPYSCFDKRQNDFSKLKNEYEKCMASGKESDKARAEEIMTELFRATKHGGYNAWVVKDFRIIPHEYR